MSLKNGHAARDLHAAYNANTLFPEKLGGAIATDDAYAVQFDLLTLREAAGERADDASTWARPRAFERARATPEGKRTCAACDGFGTRACARCEARGRENARRDGEVQARGAWPRWCVDCRGSGRSVCMDCLGTGAHRDPIGFRMGED